MSVFFAGDLESLESFAYQTNQLAIFERKKPDDADAFFRKFRSHSFAITGEVSEAGALEDIRFILENDLPTDIREDPFYNI